MANLLLPNSITGFTTAAFADMGNLEQMSLGFPMTLRRQVQEAVSTYAQLVIEDEWPKMRQPQQQAQPITSAPR